MSEEKLCPNKTRAVDGVISFQPCPATWICIRLGCQHKHKPAEKQIDMRSDWEKVFGRKAW